MVRYRDKEELSHRINAYRSNWYLALPLLQLIRKLWYTATSTYYTAIIITAISRYRGNVSYETPSNYNVQQSHKCQNLVSRLQFHFPLCWYFLLSPPPLSLFLYLQTHKLFPLFTRTAKGSNTAPEGRQSWKLAAMSVASTVLICSCVVYGYVTAVSALQMLLWTSVHVTTMCFRNRSLSEGGDDSMALIW